MRAGLHELRHESELGRESPFDEYIKRTTEKSRFDFAKLGASLKLSMC
jgi:hypothetical protein